ncbi:putative P-loop containing nucleoside triphosphate hydrolase, leucine-rich repeat domain, L [Medicago truncatula]|uniref:Putative P-loop containing nucleoside triphosphate hydrolase, leucine-rich repeat domain, L n=1 Tax=Medicago truncatula TaxID=3880 RepID=A0A396IKA2_MEDTR|nr:putative P-loop containing nucleoside triphosphate hydrolase, leucine-rich repeat domain, L [Medicago truncatula]
MAIGGLLRTKLSQDYWNDVLKSNIWELTTDELQPSLILSYRYLPAPLKRCFAYCSIFPKNSILEKNMVVQLWIAEGLVPQPQSEKSWEKAAEEYFDELVSRCLIHQRSGDDLVVNFEMHDLVNDLAMTVSSPYCIKLDEQKPNERVRHLSYNIGEYDSYDKFDKLQALKGLRTILALPSHLTRFSCNNFLSRKNITKLPNSIGNLIYLRYLNVSRTSIQRLPSETCKLCNLQTLLLSFSYILTELPKDLGKLVNLRHLDIRGTRLKEIPVQISKLENLQTLSGFLVNVHDVGLEIADMVKYSHGSLFIYELQNVIDPSDVFLANLVMKNQNKELVLKWHNDTPSNLQIQSVVFEQLHPSPNLKKLTIIGYGGNNFPNWLGGSLFGNMVYLKISHCGNCSWLPPLGQLGNLKKLFIHEMKSVKSIGIEFYGSSNYPLFQPFPLLETLEFCAMLVTPRFPNIKISFNNQSYSRKRNATLLFIKS